MAQNVPIFANETFLNLNLNFLEGVEEDPHSI